MFHSKCLHTFPLSLLVVLILSVVLAPRLSSEPPSKEEKVPTLLSCKPIKAAPGDDELRKLFVARYNCALAEAQIRFEQFQAGRIILTDLFDASKRVLESGLEVIEKRADQISLLERYFEMAKEVEKSRKKAFDAGLTGADDLERARYFRLDAEIRLFKAKRQDRR